MPKPLPPGIWVGNLMRHFTKAGPEPGSTLSFSVVLPRRPAAMISCSSHNDGMDCQVLRDAGEGVPLQLWLWIR